ncbi:MAG: hypothetical protein FWC70_02330 [Defluviitaleaceae bacterium]|nr:hypothetical protein [Defluviitaleaceae bacterium]
MVLVKIGRKDNLIAAHLALEMCQLIIVIQMLARDEEKGTNIHRYGNSEAVPILYSFASFGPGCDTVDKILAILFSATAETDRTTENFGYAKKSDVIKKLMHQFLKLEGEQHKN